VRYAYNQRGLFCAYALTTRLFSQRRASPSRRWGDLLCRRVSKCSHLSILSCLTCIGKQWRHDLWFLRWLFSERMTQVATTSVNFMVFALMGFPYESAPPLPKWPLRFRSGGASSCAGYLAHPFVKWMVLLFISAVSRSCGIHR
jgi:hypothetical protein